MADGSRPISLSGDVRRSDGGEGNRTPDLLNAIQALSQLSYAPGRQEPKIVPRGSRKVKKTALAKPQRASILQQLFHSRNRAKYTRRATSPDACLREEERPSLRAPDQ